MQTARTAFRNNTRHLQAATVAGALAEGRCDFGFLHVKAVDDTGHDRAAALKVPLARAFLLADGWLAWIMLCEACTNATQNVLVAGASAQLRAMLDI